MSDREKPIRLLTPRAGNDPHRGRAVARRETLVASITPGAAAHTGSLLGPYITHTPLLRAKAARDANVYLKCESLQITDSFKVRGALSALLGYREQDGRVWARMRQHGVVTCSSGNFAQGLTYATQKLGLAYSVVVPETITASKLARIYFYNPAARAS